MAARSIALMYQHRWEMPYLVDTDFGTKLTLHFFRTFCLMDLVCGMMDYKDQLNILTGWFHHLGYMYLMTLFINRSIGHLMVIFFIEEIPTAVMAFGIIFPLLRTDYGFGITFFIFRLGFHFFGLVLVFTLRSDPALGYYWLFALVTLLLHAHWFQG
eukprot:gene17098-20323_t